MLCAVFQKLTGIPRSKNDSHIDQSVYITTNDFRIAERSDARRILAMLIIILFLRNIRGTLIILVAIPLSILHYIYFIPVW